MKEKKARIEDALHATRAAAEEGILPGGGVALLRCNDVVQKVCDSLDGDERVGADVVMRSLDSPIRQISDNCGIDGSVIAAEVLERAVNVGYDGNTGKYVDMFKAGIVDPTKVTRSALQNAASIAGLMLTTEALVTNIGEDEDKSSQNIEGAIR